MSEEIEENYLLREKWRISMKRKIRIILPWYRRIDLEYLLVKVWCYNFMMKNISKQINKIDKNL